jgi:hypothetical protein
MTRILAVLLVATLYILAGDARNSPPVSDPQALTLAAQSIVALTGGTAISDVTLVGNATWIAGSDQETGSAILMAKGTGESRVDMKLSGGTRTDVRNDSAGYPQGASAFNSGSLQPWAVHNCWINASWFFPALSSLATTPDPTLILSYVGLEKRGGASVQHIRVSRYLMGQKPPTILLTQYLSTMDIYLDSASLFPVAMTYYAHPNDDALTNIPIEIDFYNYQAVNGVQVPFRIRKLISGGLSLDVVVTNVTFNSGLLDTLFPVQ